MPGDSKQLTHKQVEMTCEPDRSGWRSSCVAAPCVGDGDDRHPPEKTNGEGESESPGNEEELGGSHARISHRTYFWNRHSSRL